jgi:transcriptional regulator with XRE-family HTH domain
MINKGHETSRRDPIDVHVGARLKLRRGLTGTTQEKLAQAVGVSFQMIQKYEKGDCRVGASRLLQIARALDVPVAWFFEGFQNNSRAAMPNLMVAEDREVIDENQLHSKETLDLLKAYYALPENVRKHFLNMVKGMEKKGS